jgi:hypothetical protein
MRAVRGYVAGELAAGAAAGDDLGQIIEQHGVKISRVIPAVNVQDLVHLPIDWRAVVMGLKPMLAPKGFGVAPTPWGTVQMAAWAATEQEHCRGALRWLLERLPFPTTTNRISGTLGLHVRPFAGVSFVGHTAKNRFSARPGGVPVSHLCRSLRHSHIALCLEVLDALAIPIRDAG